MNTKTQKHVVRFTAIVALLLAGAVPAFADPPPVQADPPSRVGRLSFTDGTVSFHTADQTDWSPATLNYPVTAGNSFWTEPNSKAEIQFDDGEVRMDQSTSVDIVALSDDQTQIQVNQGVVNIHVATMPNGGVSVLTPLGAIELTSPGSYHVDAGVPNGDQPPQQGLVTVLDGSARFDGASQPVDIATGQSATIGGNPVVASLGPAQPTPFDDWVRSREPSAVAQAAPQPVPPGAVAPGAAPQPVPPGAVAPPPGPSPSAQYLPPGVVGYQDLDTNGQWVPAPDYGPVWYPSTVPVGWAPYTYGHWAFVPPWGWTWIDDAPWGFAPFHYGRWAFIGSRWGWVPAYHHDFGRPWAERPVYAPALVAFVGGNGFGISLSIGGTMAAVGWVALGPNEAFHPWYHSSPRYDRTVNIINVNETVIRQVNIRNEQVTVDHYSNFNHAVVVPANAFTHAAPVHLAIVAVPHEALAHVAVAGNMRSFAATPEARAGFAQPHAVGVERPGIQASVAAGPVTYHPTPVAQGAAAPPRAPGPQVHPQAAGQRPVMPGHPAPAAAPAPGQRPVAGPAARPATAAAPGPHPTAEKPPAAAAAPAPRPTAQKPPAAAAPGPHPTAQKPPSAAAPGPHPAAQKPPAAAAAPRPEKQAPEAAKERPAKHPPAAAKPRPAPEGKPGEEKDKEKKPE